MSAIVGARDRLLQATADRYSTVADGKAILMSGATPVFRVDSRGAGSPALIAITAKPVNVAGNIVFTVSAGTALTVDGNVATVNFSGMTTDTATVQARIREFDVDYIASYMVSKVYDGVAGDTGLAGINTAQAFAYKRAAAAPTDSPGDVIYTFASAAITAPVGNDLANGWSKNIPAGTAPLYVRVAGASSRNATDNIAANEWAAAVLLARDGAPGQNVAPVRIYQRAVANVAPALPNATCTFTFATGALTGLNNGWSTQVPTAGGAYLFTSGATAASTAATDDIPAVEWAAAARMAADGAAGADGANGSNGANGVEGLNGLNVAPVRIYQRGATSIAPALPSAACTFTFATGALTGLNNGWSTQVPTAGGAYLFTSGATAAARGATDDIPTGEWAAAARLAADGVTTYTWVKYGNTAAGGGFSDSPVGMSYIGLAYNKATALESDNPVDYAWSLIKGADGTNGSNGVNGAPGVDGQTTYTWIKYADNVDGTGLYDTPRASTLYLGLAVNKPGAVASTNKADYTWSKFCGDQGVAGPSGQRGTVTVTAPGYSAWSDASAVYELGHAGYGAPINRDVVTLYDATHAVTKFFVDGAWLEAGMVLNGNLLVPGTVAAQALAVDNLAAITAILGNVRAGDLYGTTLHGGAGYPTNAYTWPSNGGQGYHLSSAGLLLGNYSLGKYIEMRSDGFVAMPGLKIEGGRATFSGNVVSGTAPGFRIEMGPDDPVYVIWAGSGTKTDANAIFYLKKSGEGYFGGSLSAGTLRTAVTNPSVGPSQQVVSGPFGSNGGAITVIGSIAFFSEERSYNHNYSAGAGTTSCSFTLFRKLGNDPEVQIHTFYAGGYSYFDNYNPIDELSSGTIAVNGSFTFVDPVVSTAPRTYRLVSALTYQELVPTRKIGGGTGFAGGDVSQRLTIVTTE